MDKHVINLTGESLKRSLSEGNEESRVKKLKPYNNQTSIEMDIGNNCRGYAQRYTKTGDWYVHIRFYETSPTGKLFPSKNGMAMPLDKYKKLTEEVEEIDEALRKLEEAGEDKNEEIKDENEEPLYEKHLGENIYVRVEKGFKRVDIRKWWLPESEKTIQPTRKGVSLQTELWEDLKRTFPAFKDHLKQELDHVRYCEEDHHNQMGMLTCRSCSPNEWTNY